MRGWPLIVLCACSAGARPLSWEIDFSSEADRTRAVRVEAFIAREHCAEARAPFWSAPLARGATGAPAIPDLIPGSYAFRARAIDEGCVAYASDCGDVDLPRAMSSLLLVLQPATATPVCDAPQVCEAGLCVRPLDGGLPQLVDAGPIDGGRIDASIDPCVIPPGAEVQVLCARRIAAASIDGRLDELDGAPELPVRVGSSVARFRLGWNATYLYVGVRVQDALLLAPFTGHDGMLWQSDSIEVFLDTLHTRSVDLDDSDRHIIYSVFGEVRDEGPPALESEFELGSMAAVALHGAVGDTVLDEGWDAEIAIPWSMLGVTPAADMRMGADVAYNDVFQAGAPEAHADWCDLVEFAQPWQWREILLVE